MGKAQSFNEYAMIQSAIIETRRKIEARNDSIERQRELLLAQEDTLKRGKLMEQIESEKKSIERDKKLLKSLEEKAEKTAMKGNLSEEDKHKAQKMANKGFEKDGAGKNEISETGKTETGYDKIKNNANENKKTNANANESPKAGNAINERKGTPQKEKGELEEKIRDAKRTSPEKEKNEDRKSNNAEKERKATPEKFPKKTKRDLSLEIADARERLHIAEDHFKNSLNTQTHNAFVRTRKEE